MKRIKRIKRKLSKKMGQRSQSREKWRNLQQRRKWLQRKRQKRSPGLEALQSLGNDQDRGNGRRNREVDPAKSGDPGK